MFKRFDPKKDCSTSTQVKASVQRSLKGQLLANNKNITEEMIEELFPKKSSLIQYKVGSHLMLYCKRIEYNNNNNNDSNNDKEDNDNRTPSDVPVLFQHRDGPILPTLKFILQYPTLSLNMTSVIVDKGAIPYILGGANIMCPGLTKNIGSYMPPDSIGTDGFPKSSLEKGTGVIIFAEGKQYPLAIGVMTMNSIDIRSKNKGIGCDVAHYLGDGLYQIDEI